jgi:hypothetical protein
VTWGLWVRVGGNGCQGADVRCCELLEELDRTGHMRKMSDPFSHKENVVCRVCERKNAGSKLQETFA